jgi:hypothetical protein
VDSESQKWMSLHNLYNLVGVLWIERYFSVCFLNCETYREYVLQLYHLAFCDIFCKYRLHTEHMQLALIFIFNPLYRNLSCYCPHSIITRHVFGHLHASGGEVGDYNCAVEEGSCVVLLVCV